MPGSTKPSVSCPPQPSETVSIVPLGGPRTTAGIFSWLKGAPALAVSGAGANSATQSAKGPESPCLQGARQFFEPEEVEACALDEEVETVWLVEPDDAFELEAVVRLEGLFGWAVLDGLPVRDPVLGPKEALVVSLVVCVEVDAELVSGGENVMVGSEAAESLVGPQAGRQRPYRKSCRRIRWCLCHAWPNECPSEAMQLLAGGWLYLASVRIIDLGTGAQEFAELPKRDEGMTPEESCFQSQRGGPDHPIANRAMTPTRFRR